MCKVDNDCRNIKYAKCSDDHRCVGKSNYLEINVKTCAPLIGEHCTENSECYPIYSRCFHRVCQCADAFVRRSNNQCLSSKHIYKYSAQNP